jgi:hypothetical protein
VSSGDRLTVHELEAPYECGFCEAGRHQRCLIVYRGAGLQVVTVKEKGKDRTVNERVDVTCACGAADPEAHRDQEAAA